STPLAVMNQLIELGYDYYIFYDNFGLIREILHNPDQETLKILFGEIDFKNIFFYDIFALSSQKNNKSLNYQIIIDEIRSYLKVFTQEFSKIQETLKKQESMSIKGLLDTIQSLVESIKLKDSDIASLNQSLFSLQNELRLKDEIINSKDSDIATLRQTLISLENDLNQRNMLHKLEVEKLKSEIQQILNSKTWKYRNRYLAAKKLVTLPINYVRSGFDKFKQKFKKFFSRPIRLELLKPTDENYKHTKRSKPKVVYVGHSHHKITKSTQFLLDYLSEFFDLIDLADDSWKGGEYPDLSFIDGSYHSVIFFHSVPPIDTEEKIRCKNKIFIPMYDGFGNLEENFWSRFRDYKIINFSRKLHQEVTNLGLNSIYLQYFPKPNSFIKGEENTVFFWQRHTHLNINTITQLFKPDQKISIHIHTKVDPGQSYVAPNDDQITKYHITTSDWFEKKSDLLELVASKQIFVAPREYEGIGQSFLEAMAMGKVVIASDRPTMNEYIRHGETGILYDFHNIKPIDLENLEKIQKNTYQFMCNGYDKWIKERIKIIEFINQEI
ncbi:glycosyltransferase, partial [Candidatus Dojkabacteria bacterium]